MLRVIHLENSRSDRVIWLLEELGLEYEVERHERDAETQQAPQAMKAQHAYAAAPMLRDGERVLIESGAIFEYVLQRHGSGSLVPAVSDDDWPDYIQWLHFAEGSAMLPILLDHFQAGGLAGPPGTSPLAEMAKARKQQLFGYVESVLATREFLAGDRFTAADVMMGWVLDVSETQRDLESCPASQRYLAALRARPAYVRAKARGTSGGAAG